MSVSPTGGPPNSISGMTAPAISADGRYVAFVSRASNLIRHDKNGTWDVFVRDMKLGTTRLVSQTSKGHQTNGQSFSPAISADGRYIAFESRAHNLVRAKHDSDVFLRDMKRDKTKRVGVSPSGGPANGDTKTPAISASGRYVAFVSKASNLVHRDTNKATDIFVRDLQRKTTRRMSVSSSGHQGDGPSSTPSLSANGRYVGFSSQASNLVHGDTNRKNDVFVRDRKHHTTARVSVSSSGRQGNGDSGLGAISADGAVMAFTSEASNLVPGDTNRTADVFVREPLP